MTRPTGMAQAGSGASPTGRLNKRGQRARTARVRGAASLVALLLAMCQESPASAADGGFAPSTTATAQPPAPPAPSTTATAPPPAPSATASKRTWYGWQILIADGVDIPIIGAFIAQQIGPHPGNDTTAHAVFGTIGFTLFLVPAPVIHAVHGQPGRAVISGVLRLVLPSLGAVIGLFSDNVQVGGVLEGSAIGMGLAAILDDALLAWKEPEEPPTQAASGGPWVHWLPTLGLARDAGQRDVPTIGVVGAF